MDVIPELRYVPMKFVLSSRIHSFRFCLIKSNFIGINLHRGHTMMQNGLFGFFAEL